MHMLELLIVGVGNIPENAKSSWLAPYNMPWHYEVCNKVPWYIVPNGKYTYSWEPAGIQLLFEETMETDAVMQVATAITDQLCKSGYDARLLVIDTDSGLPVRF